MTPVLLNDTVSPCCQGDDGTSSQPDILVRAGLPTEAQMSLDGRRLGFWMHARATTPPHFLSYNADRHEAVQGSQETVTTETMRTRRQKTRMDGHDGGLCCVCIPSSWVQRNRAPFRHVGTCPSRLHHQGLLGDTSTRLLRAVAKRVEYLADRGENSARRLAKSVSLQVGSLRERERAVRRRPRL